MPLKVKLLTNLTCALYILGPDHFISEMTWDGFGFVGETRKFDVAPTVSAPMRENALRLYNGATCYTFVKQDDVWIAGVEENPGGAP